VARNRKRAKERRARRPQGSPIRPSLAPAPEVGAPDPIEHATPDVELVNAQLAVGRPEPFDEDDPELEAALEAELEAEAAAEPPLGDGAGRGRGGGLGGSGGSSGGGGGGELALPGGAAVPEPRARPLPRLIAFLQGSWRELQRVQWPDRRQVVQATGVVLGFVVVAAVFLGVADTLASHVMTFILNGHW
jgi:preprotein translocase SecE subunit